MTDDSSRWGRHYSGLKSILYASRGKEFFPLAIPSDADECLVDVRFANRTKVVELAGFRAVVDDRE